MKGHLKYRKLLFRAVCSNKAVNKFIVKQMALGKNLMPFLFLQPKVFYRHIDSANNCNIILFFSPLKLVLLAFLKLIANKICLYLRYTINL